MRLLYSLILFVAALAAADASAQRPTALDRRLDERVSVAWQGQQLGTALDRLAAAQNLPLWVDRRVDLSAPVDLTAADRSLREVFALLGAEREFAVAPFRGVLYFGPSSTTEALPALSAAARAGLAKCPPAVRRRWLEPAPWSFPRLSEPRDMLSELTKSAGAELAGAERIPHDLLPQRKLPAVAPIDRALLLLIGFDLTIQISTDGRVAQVAPIDYDSLPKTVAGRPAGVRPPRDAASPTRPRTATKRFALKIDNRPVAPVIDQLAEQLQLSVTWDETAGASRVAVGDRPISCDVTQASLDELLKAVLHPAGLAFDRDGAAVRITALP